MFSLTFFRLTFTSSWRMFLCALFAVVVLMKLGHWQLERAAEKKAMLSMASMASKRVPIEWKAGAAMPTPYQSLAIEGYYLPNILLLDNQHDAHQFGYDVVSPLALADGSIVLVDRGFIAADPSRRSLPKITVPSGLQRISGYAYYPSGKPFLLGQAFEEKPEKITIIEVLDKKMIQELLHKSVYPFIMRLHKAAANGYVRQWPVVSMPPNRHIGYAIQWYAMALVVVVLFIGLNMKKRS